MKKQYFTILVVALIIAGGALLYQQHKLSTEGTLLQQAGVTDYSVPENALVAGMPANAPSDVPLFTGVAVADVFTDTTQSGNYFYSVNALIAEVMSFFQANLPHATFTTQPDSFTADLVRGGLRTTVYVSTVRPTVYPAHVAPGKTYIRVTYNLKPLPTADEILK